jgi:hypothetical protein
MWKKLTVFLRKPLWGYHVREIITYWRGRRKPVFLERVLMGGSVYALVADSWHPQTAVVFSISTPSATFAKIRKDFFFFQIICETKESITRILFILSFLLQNLPFIFTVSLLPFLIHTVFCSLLFCHITKLIISIFVSMVVSECSSI